MSPSVLCVWRLSSVPPAVETASASDDGPKRLAEARTSCPEDAELLYSYAYSLERMRKYKEAIRQYERVTELDPSNAKVFFNMGDIYRNQEKKEEAIAAYEKGLSLVPDNARAQKRLRELLQDTAAE